MTAGPATPDPEPPAGSWPHPPGSRRCGPHGRRVGARRDRSGAHRRGHRGRVGAGLRGWSRTARCPRATPLPSPGSPGIMAAKRTPDLVPLCHPIAVTGVDVDVHCVEAVVRIVATVRTTDRTGVEMEALTAVAVAGLAVIDMVKAVDPGATPHRCQGADEDRRTARDLEQAGTVHESGAARAVVVASTRAASGASPTRPGPLLVDRPAGLGFRGRRRAVVADGGSVGVGHQRGGRGGSRDRPHHRWDGHQPQRPHAGGDRSRCSPTRSPASPRRCGPRAPGPAFRRRCCRAASRVWSPMLAGPGTASLVVNIAGLVRRGAGRNRRSWHRCCRTPLPNCAAGTTSGRQAD